MKILFWLSAITVLIADFFLFTGFVNVYFKNYNGGPESSSGSIVYQLIAGVVILIAGLIFYFLGKFKIALAIVGLPIAFVLGYLLIFLVIPYFMGERMN